jgi:multidrug efflux system membrane fusion protein
MNYAPSALEAAPPSAPPAPKEDQHTPPPSSSRRWKWLLAAVVIGGAAYWFWPKLKNLQPSPPPAANTGRGKGKGSGGTIPVVAVKAQRGSIGVYFTGLGTVTPINTVTAKSRVDGQLMKVLFSEGQIVQKDDVLVEIDPRPYQVQLEQAEGQQLRNLAMLKNARVDLERNKLLYAAKVISQQQLITQEALVTQYEGTIKSDQATVDNAKLNLTYCRITSPLTGLVGLRLVDAGNIIRASDANGMLVITQLDPISVIFSTSEDQLQPVLKRLRAGQQLRVDAFDREIKNKLATGTLQTIDNQIDPTTGTLKLRAVFDNKDGALFPSQFVNARMLVQQKNGVVLAPNAAIQRNSQNTYVWLVNDDRTVSIREITVGTSENDQSEISSGLEPGDMVVTVGVDKLQKGSKVNTEGSGGGKSRKGNS